MILIRQNKRERLNITQMVEGVTWSGSCDQAARSADISVIQAPYDKHILALDASISLGDYLSLWEGGAEIFHGQVYSLEHTSETGSTVCSCFDVSNHLLKSKGKYNIKNMTPEMIARMVCDDIQVPVAELAQTGININSFLIDGDSYYDIIMKAYTKAAKLNGKKYQLMAKGNAVLVMEKGTILGGIKLSERVNITKSSTTETIDEMVNQVNLYDETNHLIGVVKDEAAVFQFGVFQDVYTKEEGIPPEAGGKAMLKGMEQTLSVEAIGNMGCISGRGVVVEDQAVGLSGIYWIVSDSHEFKDGTHVMNLELSFHNMMDEKEYEEMEG